ncbi:MAG: TIGR01777 family oxidoreductase [Acidimicrobiia bacterium]
MKVLITGASGFIGRALSQRLTESGHEAIPLVRGEPGTGVRTWDVRAGRIDDDALVGIDAVVHLAGESIGGRWTPAKKQAILSSRIEGTDLISKAVASAKPSVFVCGSAIGFYGSRGEDVLTEDSPAGSGFLADVTVAWEEAAKPASEAGVRTVLARTALVLEDEGGSFPRMLLPFKFGIGGPLGSGRQWWAWITLEDEIRAIMHCLETDALEGPVNLAAPNPVRNGDFGKALGRALKRPALLPAPGFGLKLLLGGEFADEVLLASQRVVPTRLEQSGFEFSHPHLPAALDAVLA